MTTAAIPLTCRELVEVLSAYLEDALTPEERRRFEEHLELCDPCTTYIEQFRLTIEAAGRIDEDDLDPTAREVLLAAFADFHRHG